MQTIVIFDDGPVAGIVLALAGQWSLLDTWRYEELMELVMPHQMKDSCTVKTPRTKMWTYSLVGWDALTGQGHMKVIKEEVMKDGRVESVVWHG